MNAHKNSFLRKTLTAVLVVMLLSAVLVTAADAANTTANPPSAYYNSSYNPAASAGNVYTSNNVYATATAGGQSADFGGFGFGAIPTGATIDGVVVNLEGNRPAGGGRVWTVALSSNTGGNWTAAVNAAAYGTTDSIVTVGANNNNLGLATWTTDAQFRIRIAATAGGGTINLDYVTVTIYYHLPTTTTLASSLNPSNQGNNVTFTATVAPAAATGTVNFLDGAAVIGSGTLTGGVATFTTNALNTGTHSITAQYLGDTNYSVSTSAPLSQQVYGPPTITNSNDPTFVVGTAGSFTVTTTGLPAPTFSVAEALPSGLNFNTTTGVLSGTPAAGTSGVYTLTITATNSAGSDTHVFTLTINQAPAFTSTNNTTFSVGNAGTFTVTTTGRPNATITLTGGTLPNGVTLTNNGDGTATLAGTPAAGTGGQRTLTFTANNGVSPNATQTFTLNVNEAPAITSAPTATFTVGTAGTFDINASGYPPATFSLSAPLPSGLSLNAASGLISGTPALGTVGVYTYTVTASNGILPNATQTLTLTINKANQTITFANPPSPQDYGATFTVNPTASSGLPVTVTTTTPAVCSVVPHVPAPGYDITMLVPTGTCTLVASQGGDANYNAAPNVSRNVAARPARTTTSITSSANPSVVGQTVTFTVRVAPVTGSAIPTGTVTLTYCEYWVFGCNTATVTLGTQPLVGGIATFNISTLPLAISPLNTRIPDRVTATYNPTANFGGSNDYVDQIVNSASTLTTLVSSLNPSSIGDPVTFTATVIVAPPGSGTVGSGTVTFYDGAVSIGTGTVSIINGAGVATFTTSTLAMGSHNITAYFQGTDDFGTSTSSILVQMVRRTSATALASDLNPSIYGDTVTFTATVTGPGGTPAGTVNFYDDTTLLNLTPVTLVGGQASFSINSLLVGAHNITARYSGDPNNYVPSTSPILVQDVNQKLVVVTADNKTITYGDADPPFTYQYSGFVLGDTHVNTPPTCVAPTPHIPAGTYVGIIECSGAVDDNYFFGYVNGDLLVNPKALTITADNMGKTYGFLMTFAGTEFTTTGLIFSDTVTSVTLTSAGTPAAAPTGTYPITPSNAVGTGLNNYAITYVNGTLTVAGNLLVITANDRTKTYGQTVTFTGGPAEFTVVGLQGTDRVDSISLFSAGAVANAPVGTYPIIPSSAVGQGLSNYAIIYTAGQMDVNQALLTFDPDSHTKLYGDTFTGYTGTFTGLMAFDVPVVTPVYDSPGAVATATVTAPGPVYPITVSFSDPNDRLRNYIITVDPGPAATLTVNPRPLTVTPTNRGKIYGDTLTSADFTGTITGIQNGDNITATYDSPAGDPPTAPVGTYPIVSTLSDPDGMLGNYAVSQPNGTLTVGQRELVVTSDSQTKIYGDTFTAFTGSVVGLQNTDVITPTYASTGAGPTAAVGTYPITVTPLVETSGSLSNYNVTYNIGTLTVTRRDLTVTPDDKSKLYGETFTAFTGVVTGLQNGDAITPIYSSPGAISTATVAGSPYPITVTLSDPTNKLGNYNFTLNTGLLTVNQRLLTVTPDNQTKVYGTWYLAFTGTITGIQNGENITANYSSTGSPPSANVGTYPITATLNDPTGKLGNYLVVYTPATLTVTQASLTVRADSKLVFYGDPDPALTYLYVGFVAGDTPAVVDTAPTCAIVENPHTAVGTYTIRCAGGVDNNYSFTYVDGTLTVAKRTLTVTPADKIKLYGSVFNAFTGVITGIQYGDNITANYTSLGAPATAPVGSYDINATLNDPDGKLTNYTVVYNIGTLTVTQRTLIVTPDNKTKVYGDTFSGYTATITGLQNGETVTVNYTSAGAAPTATVAGSPYAITITLTDPGNILSNYDVTLNSALLTVTKRPLIVTPDSKAKIFGTDFTAFTGTVVGLQNNDNIVETYASTGAPAAAAVGTYPITVTLTATPPSLLNNYDVTLNQGTLTVGANVLTVIADNKSKIYGDPDPAFTFTYIGFQGTDTPAVLTAEPTCQVTVAHNQIGNFPITCAGGVDENYIFSYTPAVLTINPRPVVVTPDNKTKVYGDLFTAFTGVVNGLQARDNITVTYDSPGAAASATVTAPGPTYPITATLVDPDNRLSNYVVTLNTGTLTITTRGLTVTPDNKSKVYGTAFSAFTGNVSGLQGGDSVVVTYASLGAPATAAVGSYNITASLGDPGGILGNYAVTLNTGTLTVTTRDLVVTPADKVKTYGDLFNAFTGTITGIQNGDPITVNYASAGAAVLATFTAPGPTYPITATLSAPAGVLANYNIIYNTGTLTITQRSLIVTPDDKAKVFGTTFPNANFTGSVVGLVAGDGITVSYDSTGAPAAAAVGTYPIVATLNDPGNRLPNYAVTNRTGTLTVGANVLTVTANNQTMIYGNPDPAFTFTYSGFQGTDNASVLTVQPVCQVAVAHNAIGNYPITCAGGVDENYIFSYIPGTLTVNPRALTVVPDNKTKIYGDVFTAFTGTVTGAVGSDNITVTYSSPGAAATATVAGSPYLITATLNDPNNRLSNYTVTNTPGTLTVTPRTLTATPDNKTKVYGTLFTAFTGNIVGIQNADAITATYASTGAAATATVSAPGPTYPITVTLNAPAGVLANYSQILNTGTLTITTRDLVVTPADKTKVYGDLFTAFTGTVTGIQNSDPITVTYDSAGAAAIATVSAPGPTYPITATLNATPAILANYNQILNTGTLTITQRSLVVTPDNQSKVFGTVFSSFTGVVTGIQNGDAITPVYDSPGAPAAAAVGLYPITVTSLTDPGGRLPNYSITLNQGTMTVGLSILTVTANNQTKVYGDPDPAFTFTYSGFQGTDNASVLTVQPTCQVTVAHNQIGNFPITCSGGVDDNYTFAYVPATLTITSRPLTIAPDNKTKVYGDLFTAFTGVVNGLVASDNITITYSSTGAAATATVSAPGPTYPIIATLSDPGNRLGNYTVTNTPGTLTVTTRALIVTPDDKTKVYGNLFTAFTGNIVGIQNGDAITATYASTGAAATATVSAPGPTYPITATLNATPAILANYAVTLNQGTLTITTRDLVVTPADKTKVYGDLFTAFTGTITGIQNGDAITVNYASAGAAAIATVSAPGPTYPITATLNATPAILANYNQILNTGTLTITQRPLLVTPDNKAKVFGTVFTAFTGVVNGIQNGDAITPVYDSAGAPAAAAVGNYPITVTSLTDPGGRLPNYTVTLNTGTLTVGNTVLTVTANPQTKTYGDPDPGFTFTYSGFMPGDNASVLTTEPTCQVTVAHNQIGNFPITCSGGVDDNYIFSYIPATLTVNPRPLSITPDNKTKVYGDAFTTFTGTVVGMMASDNITVTYSSPGAAATASVAGSPYQIIATLTDPNNRLGNYTVTNTPGTLTVTQRPLTVTPDDKAKAYGENFTAFTGNIVGIQNNDAITATYNSPGAPAAATIGSYPINATLNGTAITLNNYAITYNTGTLVVGGNTLVVTPADKVKTYGTVFTAFTGTIVGLQPGDNITAVYASTGAGANANVGPYTITVTLLDPDNRLPNYAVTYNTGVLTVVPADQLITITTHAPTSAMVSTNFTVAATASSGLPVAYTATGPCTNVGPQFTIGITTGVCTVHYNQGGNANYNPAPEMTEPVLVVLTGQTIIVTQPAPTVSSVGNTFDVAATATSGLIVSISGSGGCGIDDHGDGTATITVFSTKDGVCTIRYTQAGNTSFPPAPEVTETVILDSTSPLVTVNQAAAQVDPTNVSPVNFTVVFNELVTGFTNADIVIGGTAGATTATVTEIAPNDGTTYNVAISGMVRDGTVTVTIPANAALDIAGNGNRASTSTDNVVIYLDAFGPNVQLVNTAADSGDGSLSEDEVAAVSITQMMVTFNQDVFNPAGDANIHDVTNFKNYLLVRDLGTTAGFQTLGCAAGADATADTQIEISGVTYANNTATFSVNGGAPLPKGKYRLFVCGSTSIVDPLNNNLKLVGSNGPATDFVRNFTVTGPAGSYIPVTGFAPGVVTILPPQPLSKAYAGLGDLWLDIPSLGVQSSIVGVPRQKSGAWDVSWLGSQTGYLDGSAYPTSNGNSVLTAHVYLSNGKPGPFVNLSTLKWGDQIIIHNGGKQYVYEVRSVTQVKPDAVSTMLKHQDTAWVTLVTCKGYDPTTGGYQYRILVNAVLVKVK